MERNTPQRQGDIFSFPVKANTTIEKGTLVMIEAGYATPAREALNLYVAGRAEKTVTALTAGSVFVPVRCGVFRWANATGTDLITQTSVGEGAYALNDGTVARVATGRSRAGKIVAVDGDGVWVQSGLGY